MIRGVQSRQAELALATLNNHTLSTKILERLEQQTSELPSYSGGKTASIISGFTTFTMGREKQKDTVNLAAELVAHSVAQGVNFDTNPSNVLGTITLTHEDAPRFVPVRIKYDTAADANFIPRAFIEANDLSPLLERIQDDPDGDGPDAIVFTGLNDQEYKIEDTINLSWCASNMHRMRTTKFHVAESLPFDIILGDAFILENQPFHPQRTALPLRRKHRDEGTYEIFSMGLSSANDGSKLPPGKRNEGRV